MKTTIHQAARKALKMLPPDEDARFEVLCLAEKAFGMDKTQLRLHSEEEADPEALYALARRRAAGEPLQYILGEWEFYGLPFAVGPGVLIPRPETELLVDLALEFLKGKENPVVADLCAGSGCVGLSVAHHCPNAQVHLVELSGEAMPYLRQNARPCRNAAVHQGDIGDCQLPIADCSLILSNPPYIRTDDIETLSGEVRREPRMALDGGADGLRFYRILAGRWLRKLRPGGMMAVECGEDQAGEVAALFAGHDAGIRKDFHGIERVVTARA